MAPEVVLSHDANHVRLDVLQATARMYKKLGVLHGRSRVSFGKILIILVMASIMKLLVFTFMKSGGIWTISALSMFTSSVGVPRIR